ncbi:uncharacterized protein FOMMEDRAFT_25751 [Fomitiporia mediterranea MF3/22]|uniref:uncharacterized protein n=1 Tax=Fomitiporia mediterranea (strain MF3/22) TaxID=694068 RepID=UPI0004407D92|nr:uncharacterized protein FOMMEDRAFT_25751 [Fomitiporia mediterranea MF3/22]EJD06482.1 hypothetical protein FOMMEDRAFT_25751 [Fomitiporia mediterranea MF3/22]
MFLVVPLLAVAGLASLQGVHSQLTTATVFPGDPNAESLQGEILGTGSDGTTYAISGIFSGVPATATLVENASHLSERIAISTAGGQAEFITDCSMDENHEGSCSVILNVSANGIETATTSVASATISLSPIELKVGGSNSAIGLTCAASLLAAVPLISFGLAFW